MKPIGGTSSLTSSSSPDNSLAASTLGARSSYPRRESVARLVTRAYTTRFARFMFLALAEIHKVDEALQRVLGGLIVYRTMVDGSLPLRCDPQDLCKSCAEECCGNIG